MMIVLLLLALAGSALAGSPCPPREDIYPCSCMAVSLGKKIFFTTVTCHRLTDTDSLNYIFPALRSMTIERFFLYDSFWEANKLGTSEGENKQVLPADWLTVLKVKEMEIVDTTLSSCFACHNKMACRNSVTVRFTAVNSSAHDKICTLCDARGGSKFSWTGCMSKLKEFHFRQGGLTTVRADLFPQKMTDLVEVDLSHNRIAKIESSAFQNLPKLKILILAHNALESLTGMFTKGKLNSLEKLDLSWNFMKTLSDNFFESFPKIKTIILNNNNVEKLEENEWKDPPDSFRTVDLQDNPLHCDCDLQWLNTTFHINVIIHGRCATPEEFENSLIRRASRLLNERCTDEGIIGTRSRKPKSVTTPMSLL